MNDSATPAGMLVPLDKKPDELFTSDNVDALLAAIRQATVTLVPDVTTEDGRAAIKSLAYKVARSKTAIDDLGKDYVAELKAKPAAIDALRKRVRDNLDALKDEVRKPLTDWEAEQALIEQAEIDRLRQEREAEEERQREEQRRKDEELEKLRAQVAAQQQAEAERLAAEQAERDRLANEERIRAETEERVKREAEERVAAAEREAADAKERERQQAERAEQERQEAAERQRQAVADAEERERKAAAKREQERLDAEERQRAEDAARAADIEHRRVINVAAAQAIAKHANVEIETASAVLVAIIRGQVPNVTINY